MHGRLQGRYAYSRFVDHVMTNFFLSSSQHPHLFTYFVVSTLHETKFSREKKEEQKTRRNLLFDVYVNIKS